MACAEKYEFRLFITYLSLHGGRTGARPIGPQMEVEPIGKPIQHESKMVNMIENQREGLGLVLGALWIAFANKFNNEKI